MDIEDSWECAICLEAKNDRLLTVDECGKHFFHEDCMQEYNKYNHNYCPVCRHPRKPRPRVMVFVGPMWASLLADLTVMEYWLGKRDGI
jgi:hypothetical protein